MAVFRLAFCEIFLDTERHMKILRRNLSLMLAVRYLNPLRTMFSIITLICLGGVALGVMILVVVLSVMDSFGATREECLYIGDTSTDMQTGKRAGMRTVGVLWGFRDLAELTSAGATVTVERACEVKDFI